MFLWKKKKSKTSKLDLSQSMSDIDDIHGNSPEVSRVNRLNSAARRRSMDILQLNYLSASDRPSHADMLRAKYLSASARPSSSFDIDQVDPLGSSGRSDIAYTSEELRSSRQMTYRFTVNLPQNQKKVLRISPKLLLGEVRQIVCQDKGYDPKGYVFLLPGKPKDVMDDNTSVGDLKSSEINFVSITMLDAAAAKSLPDLAFAASQAGGEGNLTNQQKDNGQVPVEGQKKAKNRFLSFLGKKEKKFKIQTESSIEEPATSNRTRKTEGFNVRPKTMYADPSELEHFNLRNTTSDLLSINSDNKADHRKSTGSSLIPLNENKALSVHNSQPSGQHLAKEAPPKKSGKKRAAPPPPKAKPQTVQVEIEVKPKTPQDSETIHGNKSLQDDLPERVHVKRFHSRNSSDSSGYHELTLSGADSPDGVKINNLHTTLDTTSISSADHFNGDSGIRDMSPVRSRGYNKGNRAGGSRDSSIDIDKPDVPVPGGKKKKRAPLPPPTDASDDELAALKAMEEVTMKFNIDDSEEETESGMKMVEDSSIYSEDLDVDLSHRQRPPATFIAPPPPTEPPPVDSEPVDMRFGVSTTDIGVGEDTTASPRSDPESVKTSPVNTPSLPGSSRRSSISSVNTIEDLSLAFKQTIAMGEEGLDSDLSDNENVQDELQKEMGEFKDKISQLADEETDSGEHNESKNSNSSFIIHDSETTTDVLSNRPDDARGMVYNEGNRESSEITYEFTIDAVPAEFQNGEEEEEEEDEEHFEEEIVEILPADPKVFNMDSPRRIPDLESPKEHKSLAMVVHESLKDGPVDISTPKDKPEVTVDKPKEKEEFVISLDELSNVEYSISKPKEHSNEDTKQKEAPRVNYRIEFRNSRDYDSHPDEQMEAQSVSNVQQVPMSRDNDADMSGRSNIKNQCSELSFTPDYETEVEHVMEEKSISMMNFPVEQTPVANSPKTVNDDTNDNQTYASSTKLVLSQNNSMSSQGSETSPRKDSGAETPNLLQLQYQQLQQQFSVWQSQLVQNQQLLATNQNSPGDDQSNIQLQQLQLQIQMQQQMLFQMQQNMNALALQNSMASQQQQQQQQQQPVGMATMQTMPTMPIAQQPFLVPTATVTTEGAPIQSQRPASPVVVTNEIKADVPAPPPPPTLSSATAEEQPKKKTKQRRIKERVLEPREQLMLDIRNFGKKDLHKVPVKATKWHK